MTAEIAVMNKVAVALAADSAATSSPGDKQKIFNSANKLFQLDGSSPVGIMIYGSSEFMGVPWETVIKLFRKFHKGPHDNLQQYGEDFLRFIASSDLLTDTAIEDYFLSTVRMQLYGIRVGIAERLKAIQATAGTTTFADAAEHFSNEVLANITIAPKVENVPADFVSQLLTQFEAKLDAEITAIFGSDDPGIVGRAKIKELLCAASIVEPNKNDSDISGLVIAGFGEVELYPDIWNCHIRGLIPMRLLQFGRQKWAPVTLQNNASITPFAQDEMVHSFMTGIDPELKQTMLSSFDVLLRGLLSRLPAQISNLSQPQIDQFNTEASVARTNLMQNLQQEVANYSRDKHVIPVMAAVGILPKDELAVMAETLVALTSFKRRMSSQAETVGGAIDVAIISKGDGFIWIKRKHYFDPALNVRYIDRIKSHANP